jgi:hypothetical protein
VLETPAASSFSLTAYLNTLLPSAAALTPETLAGASAALDDEAARSDAQVAELIGALRARAAALQDGRQGDAETVPQLMQQLEQIREKASQSEAAMREITREINALDRAKRNVVGSMTALKRLWMLGESAQSGAPWSAQPGAMMRRVLLTVHSSQCCVFSVAAHKRWSLRCGGRVAGCRGVAACSVCDVVRGRRAATTGHDRGRGAACRAREEGTRRVGEQVSLRSAARSPQPS